MVLCWQYWEYGTTILLIIEALTIPLSCIGVDLRKDSVPKGCSLLAMTCLLLRDRAKDKDLGRTRTSWKPLRSSGPQQMLV